MRSAVREATSKAAPRNLDTDALYVLYGRTASLVIGRSYRPKDGARDGVVAHPEDVMGAERRLDALHRVPVRDDAYVHDDSGGFGTP